MEFGVQLYGVSEMTKSNPDALFARIHEMGFRTVEPCVVFGSATGFENIVWTPSIMEATFPFIQKHHLSVASCHVFTDDISVQADDVCAFARRYGIKTLVIPCPLSADQAEKAINGCREFVEKLRGQHIDLLVHNGSQELTTRVGDTSLYEWFVASIGAGMQADVGWLAHAGYDVERFLWHNEKTVRSLHYKDLSEVPASAASTLPYDQCFHFACSMGIPQVVDQDSSNGDIMEDIFRIVRRLMAFSNTRC